MAADGDGERAVSEHTTEVGRVETFDKAVIVIGTDCDLVTLHVPEGGVRLTPQQRDEMDRYLYQADMKAAAWADDHGCEEDEAGQERGRWPDRTAGAEDPAVTLRDPSLPRPEGDAPDHRGPGWPVNGAPAGPPWPPSCPLCRRAQADHPLPGCDIQFIPATPEGIAQAVAENQAAIDAGTACPECNGTGEVEVGHHTCGTGPDGYYGIHEPGCGTEPCPRGCPYIGQPKASGPCTFPDAHRADQCNGYHLDASDL